MKTRPSLLSDLCDILGCKFLLTHVAAVAGAMVVTYLLVRIVVP